MSRMNKSCDPATFYNLTQDCETTTLINLETFLTVINNLHSPFLVILPFCVKKLKTNCRQIIAMIALSELIRGTMDTQNDLFGQHWNSEFPWICFILTQSVRIARNWSEFWSLALILGISLTLKPRLGLCGASKTYWYLCHVIIWPSSIIINVVTSGVPFYDLEYFDANPFLVRGCRGDFQFEITEDGQDCVGVGTFRYIAVTYFGIILFLVTLGVLLFIHTFWIAFQNWRKRVAEALDLEHSLNSEKKLEHIYDVAAANAYTVLTTVLRLSVTILIYFISVLALSAAKLKKILTGKLNNKVASEFFCWWPGISNQVIGTLIVFLYLYWSPVFRAEVAKLLVKVLRKLRIKVSTREKRSLLGSRKSSRKPMGESLSTSVESESSREAFTATDFDSGFGQ